MADTPRKDHWASLLESIGLATASPQKAAAETAKELVAEVPAAKAPEAHTAAEPVAAAAEPPKPAAKKPAKTSGHWGKLAGMLGLSVAQPPEPEPEPEPVAVAPVAPPPPPVAPPAPVAESRPQISDDLPADLFAPPARAESEARPASAARDRGRDRDRDRGGRGQDSRSRDSRPAEGRSAEAPAAEGRRDSRDSERGPERGPRAERSSTERAPSDRGPSDRGPSDRGPSDRGRGRGRDERRDEGERRPPRREGQQPRRGFGDGLIEDWPPESHVEPAAEGFEHDDFVPAREVPREPARDLRDEPPAVDDRLGFDRPADEGEGGEHRRRRRRRRRGGPRDEEETVAHQPHVERIPEDLDEPVAESFREEPFVDDEFAEVPLVDEDIVAEEDRPARRAPGDSEGGEDRGPRRRRRRRRGGSSRRDDAAEAPRSAPAPRATSRSDDDSDLEDEFEAERPAPPTPRGRPQRDTRRVVAEDDEVDEMLQAELEDDGGEGHAHKKIPTWQETVGVLIDGNMSMRSERPETRGGRGRRPPHRGR